MKVLLIHPNCGFQVFPQSAPLGLMSIATYLKERGYDVRIYDRNVEKLSLEKIMRTFMPDVAGVAVTTMLHINDGIAISERLRRDGIPIIWGGFMASIEPEMILRESAADFVVIGEGEVTFHELLQAIENKSQVESIHGIVFQDTSGVAHRTPKREFADLADFPIIDWSFVDPKKYFAPRISCKRMMFLYASKGCPGRCAFCYNESFHRSKCRKRPNEYIISEIKELATKHGLDGVYFTDEMFGLNKKDLHDLCYRLRVLNLGITWGCQTKLGHFNREDLQMMYDSGCRWIFFGVESGSQEMLERIQKGIDLGLIGAEIQFCREIGISSHCGIILGLPDETEAQLMETVDLMLHLDATLVVTTMFFPMPGSEFCNNLLNSGRLTLPQTLQEWSDFRPQEDLFANFSEVSTRDLHVIQAFFHWCSFFRKDFPKDTGRYIFAFNTIITSLRNILRQGFGNLIKYAFSSVRLFLSIVWYVYAYPGIRKKYGLYAKRKRQIR